MMREPVCIVLNEREPHKARAAEALLSHLAQHGINGSRLEISSQIEDIIVTRSPLILVLDYLLGDYSTGLDVLGKLQSIKKEKRPEVFFLTDEPSVQVAVEAMRLGARNYLEVDNPQAVMKLVQEIHELLCSYKTETKKNLREPKHLCLDDIIAQAKSSQDLVKRAKSIIAKQAPLIIVHGSPGSGVSTLAWALAYSRGSSLPLEVDLRICNSPAQEIFGLLNASPRMRLGEELSLIIEHAEQDDGECLNLVLKEVAHKWKQLNWSNNNSFLTICTSSKETVKAWKTVIPFSEVLTIPTLKERQEDIPSFVQTFAIETSEISNQKYKAIDSATITWLSTLEWPGGIAQLKAVVQNSLFLSTVSHEAIKDHLEESRVLWEEEQETNKDFSSISSLVAAQTLEICGHNYRMAAAYLGCGTKKLWELVGRPGYKSTT